MEAANLRIAEIEYEKSIGTFRPPTKLVKAERSRRRYLTVADLLEEYVQLHGLKVWGDSYLSYARHRIKHYINPFIGEVLVQDLTTHSLDLFYDSLLDKPAVAMKGQPGRTISASVVEKVHTLLRSALNQAVAWGYITTNPADHCTLPPYKSKPRRVWTTEEVTKALTLCTDQILKACMLIAIGCSLRIGEILGLTWDCVNFEEGTLFVNKEQKRCDKTSLNDLDRKGDARVFYAFPNCKPDCSTVLVLKAPKTDSSVRIVYMPKTVQDAVKQLYEAQQELKDFLAGEYQDYNLVIAQNNGRPFERRLIENRFKALIRENDLPPVVFHSLRHTSTTLKLQLASGDIKAVQGDTGHAQARMVTDVYAAMHNEDRRRLPEKVESEFFGKMQAGDSGSGASNPTTQLAHELLEKNPELAQLLIAASKAGDK